MEKKQIELVIELPKPKLQPVNGRLYVKGFSAEEAKTKSGIYLPTNFVKIKGEERQEWNFERYFVLAVAEDVNILVNDNGKVRRVQRGDEIAIFYHEDALKYQMPQVMDFGINDKYGVLHETEIAGVMPLSTVKKE